MKLFVPLTAAAVIMTGSAFAQDVTVSIEGVQPGSNSLLVALQTEDEFLQKEGSYTSIIDAAEETASTTFEGVEPGSYAVAVVHDQDGDGDFTVGESGPMEGWGLSGEMPSDAAPTFEDAMIEVMDGEDTDATVMLTYPQ